jgi:hypothetical protein
MNYQSFNLSLWTEERREQRAGGRGGGAGEEN